MQTMHRFFLPLGLLCGSLILACATSEEPVLQGADPTLAGSGGASAGASGEAGGGQAGSSAGKGGAGQGGAAGQAGQAGAAGGGAAGAAGGGAAGAAGGGAAGAAGGGAAGAAGGGAAGAAGAACDPDKPPPDAACAYDTDCDLPEGLSPGCADMVCDVCGTWTCKVKAKNVGFGCVGANKCNEAVCNAQGQCNEGAPKKCTSPDACSEGSCNPDTGACEFKPASEGLPCPSNDPCVLNKTCQDGVCAGGTPKCQEDACRTASCSFGACNYKAKSPAPTSCDDGDLCTENDACVPDPDVASRCQGKPIQIDCSSFNQSCLKGVCDPATGQCAAAAVNDGDACNDGLSCTSGDACSAGVCKGVISDLEHVFYEDFSDNGKGWQLQGGWVIGEAKGSSPKPKNGNPDPTEDTTQNNSDNKLAGAVLGGNGAINGQKGGPWYLISPEIDLSGVEGQTFVQFRRWLNTGDPTSMTHTIEVFDGAAWQTIFTTVASIKDSSWKIQSYDITGYKNAAFRVRFGYQVDSEKFDYTGWNIDDLVIGTPSCDLGGGGSGGAGGAGGAGQGGAGQGGAAGAGGQSGGGQGGAGGATFVKVAGCTYETATDLTGASAMIQQVLLSYKPPCIRVKVGQTVTWTGEINKQPFKGMVGYGTQPNPILGPYVASPTEITFDAPGSYGFYSLIAGAEGTEDTGMSGAVFVEP